MARIVIALMAAGAVFAATPVSAQSCPSSLEPELFFSEYIEGSSNNKALEIYNPTGHAVNLATCGYSVQMFFNGNPSAGLTINLTGTVAADDVYVLAQSSATAAILARADQTNGSGWFNGDDAVVLRRNGVIVDSIGQIGFDPGSEWGSGLASTADNTLRRKTCQGDPDATDVFDPAVEWDGFATDTFDGLGAHECNAPPPPVTDAEIHEIQGAGLASPLAGQNARTQGNIVTAVGPAGFFMQAPEARADADPATSEGIFVFTGTAPVGIAVGDEVDVTGVVVEFFEMTEFTSGATIEIISSGNPLPAVVAFGETLPSPVWTGAVPELERYEGMVVRVDGGLVTGPSTGVAPGGGGGYQEFSVVASAQRPFREPGIAFPGLPGLPVWDGNPEVFAINPDGLGLADVAVSAGATVTAEGPLAFAFSLYQIWPASLTIQDNNPQQRLRAVRGRAPGEFTVASQNLLRLFADSPTPSAYQTRLAKASLQIRQLLGAPDVVVVQEVGTIDVLLALAQRIHLDDASLSYEPYLVEGNDPGGIDVGFLVRNTVTVTSVVQFGKADTYEFNGQQQILNDRPPLVLRGAFVGSPSDPGQPFPIVVVGVHQRSLNGIDGADGPRIREKRHQQALRLSQFLQTLQTDDPLVRLVVAGDFNAFEFTDGYVDAMGQVTGAPDPLGALIPATDVVNPDLRNHTLDTAAGERYSYVFQGSAQSLDHVLTSSALLPAFRGLAHSRGNSDVPQDVVLTGDATTALATADHDGSVLFVMGDFDGDGFLDDQDACVRSDPRATLWIQDENTGVNNTLFSDGCRISDRVDACAAAASVLGEFVSCVSALVNALVAEGYVPVTAKGVIIRSAGHATLP